jgi:Acetyltransferase (GNAT) domain
MKDFARAFYSKLVSPALRFKLRNTYTRLKELSRLARLWDWEIIRLPYRNDSQYNILYIGRKARREWAWVRLRADSGFNSRQSRVLQFSPHQVLVSEMPIPGALRVPWFLSTAVSLGRPIEEIMKGYDSELRRNIRKLRPLYRLEQALGDAEIERADRELLQPYAKARHGSTAAHFPPDAVRRLAKHLGRLDLVLLGDEVVACHLGKEFIHANKRYWSTLRFGYPEAVYSDPKRLREINSINTHLALEWAINNGFDYYDIGDSTAQPDNGLLQWKRRRGGNLITMSGTEYIGHFYIRPPSADAAKFFWDAPLFVVERNKLTLHLGLPDGPTDNDVAKRYREMGFGGLFKVYLHYARPPGEHLLNKLRGLYEHQKTPPVVEIISST